MEDKLICIPRKCYFEWKFKEFYAVEVIGAGAILPGKFVKTFRPNSKCKWRRF